MSYTPVRISTLKAERPIPFSVYIYFKETYLEYIQPDVAVEEEKITKLKKQKITKFFILDTDEEKYQAFLDSFLEDVLNDPNASTDKKVDVTKSAAETAIEKIHEDPGSEVGFNMAQTAAAGIHKLLKDEPDALKKIFVVNGEPDESIVTHSMNVCSLVTKLAEFKKLPKEEIENLATAALMHDCGLSLIGDASKLLFREHRRDLEPKQRLEYFKHTGEAIKVLKDKEYINHQIIKLVENHEETNQGTGPNHVQKLTLPEEILCLCNVYDKFVTIEEKDPVDAMKELKIEHMGNYSLELITDLEKVIKTTFKDS